MWYFDPERPSSLSGRASYVFDGRAVAALPELCVEPASLETCHVSVWLMVGYVTARAFTITIPTSSLAGLLHEWTLDPEKVMVERFGYVPLARLQAQPVAVTGRGVERNLTLADLGF